MVYCTKLAKQRYVVECIVVSEMIKISVFTVDTGARFSCCYYIHINDKLKESEVQDLEVKYLGGLIRGHAIKFYRYPLKQFTVGNINTPVKHIWITFDSRITDKVLGMDILKDVTFLNKPAEKTLYFFDKDESMEPVREIK